ncbi:hypothetical protein F5X96DRAFT_689523 [Biscogniauxia mediterranea]|nr:hypothetical protein F5X96DRAFT_689523 [Biscogniauxia mediterranea]
MVYQRKRLLSLFFTFIASATTCWAAAVASASTPAPLSAPPPALFHGTSVVILPDGESPSPTKSSLRAANFFCYMTDKGYFSFGWWVPADAQGNTTHCRPDSDAFHWYEHAALEACDAEAGTCTYRTRNVGVRRPASPFPERPLEYVIRPLDLGNGRYGQMAISWIDDGDVRVYGIGTRRVLSGTGGGTGEEGSNDNNNDADAEGCAQALKTLRRIRAEYGVKLGFKLVDICGTGAVEEDEEL